MATTLELVAVKLLGPGAAIALGAAALAGGEAVGLDVGAAELGGAAIALFLLREVFAFVRWFIERRDPPAAAGGAVAVAMPSGIENSMEESVRLLRELRDEMRAQKQVCVLGDVDARDRFFEALARVVRRAEV